MEQEMLKTLTAESVFKKINRVPSRLLIWGNPFSCEGNDVILCITGNPGIIDFYYEFGSELYRNTGLPVCVIGQAGHEVIPHDKNLALKGEEHLYDLEGQIEHKLDLINNIIDKQSNLHLIGHSIGAWLIIEALDKQPSVIERVLSINLLFPTIQEMATTENGKYVNKVLRKFKFVLMIFLKLLNMLPKFVLEFVARIYLRLNSLPSQYTVRVLKYVNPTIMEKVLFMAFYEMDRVTTLNIQAIDKVKHLVNVLYGESDGWVPLEYMADLKQFQPQLQMKEVPYPHDFVLKSSENVAEIVSDYIKEKKKTS